MGIPLEHLCAITFSEWQNNYIQ